jgi:DnaJ-domain-containing protein 1
MDEKAKAARRAYKREWAKKNPDKVRAYQDRYWKKKAREMEATQKAQEDRTGT